MKKPTLRLLRTVRHLGKRQIATRALRVAERVLWRAAKTAAPAAPPVTPRPHEALWRVLPADPDAIARALEVLAGRFTFLGESRPRASWNVPDASHLWRFHLHYFDYLRDLAIFALHRDRAAAYATFRELASSWIDAHQRLGGDAWHPYTISLRVVNWCEAAMFFRNELANDAEFSSRLIDSIAAQSEFLSNHVEHDVRGNHILENARALVRASSFFEGEAARRWRQIAVTLLEREIPEQILADGGHFERAPGYHVRVLEVLTDIARLLPMPWIEQTVERMHEFLDAIVPPNGRLPLLKDTVLPDAPVVLRAPQPSRWLEASGYAVIRDDARGDHLIADFGRVCPDYLPAHAHADMFSFELTIGGVPVIVDSGVFQYAGEWRNHFRSTAAHNTVQIDGRDQSEMWGTFRVGRRARVRRATWTEAADRITIDGTHDGYAPVLHRRVITVLPEPRLWVVLDHVSKPRRHIARSFIHLHPDHADVAITPLGATIAESTGWYSERFGTKRENRVLELSAKTPAWFGYIIAAHDAPEATLKTTAKGATVTIETATWRGTITV